MWVSDIQSKHRIIVPFQDYITVSRGEKIQIEFSMKPNGKNKRDLDMNLKVDHDGAVASLHENNEYKMRWISFVMKMTLHDSYTVTHVDITLGLFWKLPIDLHSTLKISYGFHYLWLR